MEISARAAIHVRSDLTDEGAQALVAQICQALPPGREAVLTTHFDPTTREIRILIDGDLSNSFWEHGWDPLIAELTPFASAGFHTITGDEESGDDDDRHVIDYYGPTEAHRRAYEIEHKVDLAMAMLELTSENVRDLLRAEMGYVPAPDLLPPLPAIPSVEEPAEAPAP